jgi:predicted esterase
MSSPAAVPDLERFGIGAEDPTVTEISSETAEGVTVTDLTYSASDIETTEAYLVAPADGERRGPGIIWFHWVEYGNPTSNRTEFLPEARAMAARGAVSILVQGRMPWLEPPESIAHDVPAVEREVRMLWYALVTLGNRPEVDADRGLAIVGHDFGAMYGSVFFGWDGHLDGMVMMAPTARWADWFYRYWDISDPEDEYLAAMAGLDPVTWLPLAAPRPVLLQFAEYDEYVPADVAAEISAAAGASAETRTYEGAGHELNEAAMTDRATWLAELLGL